MNEIAYNDVLDQKEPRFPENKEYMRKYQFWTEIANRPEDQIEE